MHNFNRTSSICRLLRIGRHERRPRLADCLDNDISKNFPVGVSKTVLDDDGISPQKIDEEKAFLGLSLNSKDLSPSVTLIYTAFPILIHNLIHTLFGPSALRYTLMNIEIQNIPSPSKLITTMDKHRFGAAMFIIALLICSLAVVGMTWVWLLAR